MNRADRFQSRRDQTSEFARWAPVLAGGALLAYGLSRRSKGGALLAAAGGAVAYRGIKTSTQAEFARSTVLVNKSAAEVFQFWRRFENLPRFMHHVESVNTLSDKRSKWVAYGPANARVEWEAEIIAESPNELIAWRSAEGSEIRVDGSIEFREAPGKRGTIIDATIQYRPPAGGFGRAVAKLFGKDPSFLMEQDLRRFKALIETGEIPTTEGQSHGPRSAVAAAARLADPDRGRRRPQTTTMDTEAAARRVS